MEHIRAEIWDFVYKTGPQTANEIAAKLRLNEQMVKIAVDHEWFTREGETVAIATNERASSG